MTRKKVALFGGSFNPFGLHHRKIVELLLQYFDLVLVIICGLRPDKLSTNNVDSAHRLAMTKLSLLGLDPNRVRVEDFDLTRSVFTKCYELQEMFASEGDIFHVVGGDLICGGASGQSHVQHWVKADLVWETFNFAVIQRPGYVIQPEDLPPHSVVLSLEAEQGASSQEIRRRVASGESISGIMVPQAEEYLSIHGLYKDTR
ncbi:MAG: hypothetical protein KBC81_00200 [Candidatus Pacebacteria bacterium]|nr:hypothetical protein [Candidatus Paceibacterota bacterium]